MRLPISRTCALAAIAATILFLAGCTITHTVTPDPQLDMLPPVPKGSLHAGVYYSPQFASHEQTRRFMSSSQFVAGIGKANVKMFDDLTARVFERTTKVTRLSAEELRANGVEVVVAPSLVHFDFRLGLDSESDRYSIAYRITLYSAQGVPIESWVVNGKAAERNTRSEGSWVESWVEANMQDAAAKFLEGFQREAGPVLAAIAANRQRPANPIDLRNVQLSAIPGEFSALEPEVAAALSDAGVLAVRLVAESASERRLVVRASDTRLRLKDGRTIEPATISSVLAAVDRASPDGMAAAALAGPLIGLLVAAAADSSAQQQREIQHGKLTSQLFLERFLRKGKEESGIVAFLMPAGAKAGDVVGLTAWIVDPALAEGTLVEKPLQMAP